MLSFVESSPANLQWTAPTEQISESLKGGESKAKRKAMTIEQAIEYALSEEEPAPPTPPMPEEPPAEKPLGKLTQREEEIAELLARGLTNRQISTELGISERTAGNHVARILRKLGLRSRAQIASWVTERQLLAPEPD